MRALKLGSELRHQLRRTEAGGLPDAVSDRAETEHILAPVGLDELPGVAGGFLAGTNRVDLEVVAQPRPELVGSEARDAGNETMRGQDQ